MNSLLGYSLPKIDANLFQLDPSKVLKESDQLYTEISGSFDVVARDLMTKTGIFTVLVKYALVIALAALAYFLVQWARKMMSGQEAVSLLAWPVIALSLLSGHGKMLAQLNLGARNIGIGITQDVLSQTIDGVKLQDHLKRALRIGSAEQLLAQVEKVCAIEPEGERRNSCRNEQRRMLRDKLDELAKNGYFHWTQRLRRAFFDDNPATQLILSSVTGGASMLGYNFASVMVWTLEVLLLVVMITSPLALALSLLPLPGRPIAAWASAFVGVTMAKIGLIAANAITAAVIVSSSVHLNTLIMPFFMAVGAPIIATTLAVAAGGGTFLSITGIPLAFLQVARSIRR